MSLPPLVRIAACTGRTEARNAHATESLTSTGPAAMTTRCPQCGNPDLAPEGGCPLCRRCGWSPCAGGSA